MQILILILQIVFIALGILGFFYIKNLLPSYFSEKGKNLATKEDIEEITEKIKSVETKIKIKESGRIDYETLKRRAILDYFSVLTNWLNIVVDAYIDTNQLKNARQIEKMEEAYQKYNIKQGEVEIFINDGDFYKLRKEVSLNILKLQQDFEVYTETIKLMSENKTYKISEKVTEYNNNMLKKLQEDVWPKRNNLVKYLSDIVKSSFEE